MGRSLSRAARLRKIENLLFNNAGGMRVVELAEACDVNRRTIYRDLELLEESGVPIWQEGSQYGIIRDQYLATIRLRFAEAAALYIATRLLSRHADEHNPHIVSALQKIAAAFPEALAEHITRTAKAIQQRPVNTRYISILETITLCWADHHKVRVWYRSPRSGIVRTRIISPYLVEPSSTGSLYVIGYDEWASDIRTFNLDRLEQAERLPETYTIPEEFEAATYLSGAWGIMGGQEPTGVILQFEPQTAPLIRERIWHSSQQMQEHPDGSVQLTIHVSDPREMQPWIRSWGSAVEVIAPAFLRENIAQEARETAEIYADEVTG